MIKSFKHKGLEKLFYKGVTSGVKQDHVKKLASILNILDIADCIEDMNIVGFNLHKLSGNLQGQWSVKVNGNWRVFFKFENGNTYIVDYDDYH